MLWWDWISPSIFKILSWICWHVPCQKVHHYESACKIIVWGPSERIRGIFLLFKVNLCYFLPLITTPELSKWIHVSDPRTSFLSCFYLLWGFWSIIWLYLWRQLAPSVSLYLHNSVKTTTAVMWCWQLVPGLVSLNTCPQRETIPTAGD